MVDSIRRKASLPTAFQKLTSSSSAMRENVRRASTLNSSSSIGAIFKAEAFPKLAEEFIA
jgi:hypothetical protein